jgi:hypothetical protein
MGVKWRQQKNEELATATGLLLMMMMMMTLGRLIGELGNIGALGLDGGKLKGRVRFFGKQVHPGCVCLFVVGPISQDTLPLPLQLYDFGSG